MSSEPSIQTNVDVFSENGGYFVRTEIEARIVQVHGPVADAETAKRQQADQVARLKASTDALPTRAAAGQLGHWAEADVGGHWYPLSPGRAQI